MTRHQEWRLALLEAQMNTSTDGILVVDERGRKVFQNERVAELFNVPAIIAADENDGPQRRWAAEQTVDPAAFAVRVAHLVAHPAEPGRDEVFLKNGTVLDRYSSPVVGKDGVYYGRIWTFRDITAAKAREESLQLLRAAVEQSRESIVITDAVLDRPGPRILFVNPAFTHMTGYTADEVIGLTPRILQGPLTDTATLRRLREELERGETFAGEAVNYRRNGEPFDLEWQVAPLVDAAGTTSHYVAIQRDVTERKRIAAQLFQSQKLETVGRLAGGVAHEFNSILTTILGQSQLLLDHLPAGSALAWHATEIGAAAGRAAGLTRQLLAYGRKQSLQPERIDLNAVLAGMDGVLRHLMGSDVNTRMLHGPHLRAVHADAGQIEQVILNLAMNARDAMPDGGKVTFETANVSFEQDTVGRSPDLAPGAYAMLAITDTGSGMSAEVRAQVFEPFFSTKAVGRGTGLGLSTCYGIVKQSRGHIAVYSEPERGTTFRIYLPEMDQPAAAAPERSEPLPRGTETVLLVEDDPALREMETTLLVRLGYRVLSAANGLDALSVQQQPGVGPIDILFTDMVIPHMGGQELAQRVRAIDPGIKVLFTSAYTEHAFVHQGLLPSGVTLLQKPFTPGALARMLRDALDAPAPGAATGETAD